MKKIMAFTLAEIIISLTLLGILSAIVIPSTIKNTTSKTRRTKIQKAVTTYNKALEQYYLMDYANYSNTYSSITSARSAEYANYPLSGVGMTTEQRKANSAARTEIRKRYNTQLNDLKQEYTNKFLKHYKVISSTTSDSATYYKMKDGLWWYFGSDPAMLSVIVAFDIENPATKKTYTLTELQNAANSKEEKAFYILGEKKSFMTTPIVNITSPGTIDDQVNTILQNMSNVNNYSHMWKLYNYINNITNTDMADVYCTGSYNGSCCKDTTGSCMSFSTPESYNEVMYTDDGYISKLESYDKKTGKLVQIVDEKTRQMKVFKEDGSEECYTLRNWNTSKWNGNRGDWYRNSTPDASCKF